MASEWHTTTLGEVTSWSSGGTPSKSKEDFWMGQIPWISADSMRTITIEDSGLHISDAGLQAGSRLARKGAVLLLVRGGALHSRVPIGVAMRNVAFNQDVKAIVPSDKRLHDSFLLAWFLGKTPDLLGMVDFTGIGAGKLDTDRLHAMTFHLPPLDEQDAIVQVFQCLQDRISQLERTSTLLEEMAQAIFKSWFVDFDPVRAKAEGREPEDMDAVTAALFPSVFEECAIGSIPEGWSVATLGSTSQKITKGTTPTTLKRAFVDSGVNFIKAESISDEGFLLPNKFAFIDTSTNELLRRSQIEPSDVLVTIAGTIGRVAEAQTDHLPANTNQAVAIIRPNVDIAPACFIKRYLRLPETQQRLRERTVEAVQANVSLATLAALQMVLPPPEVLRSLCGLILEPLDQRVGENIRLGRTLTALRDTLLPRLISGKLRVPEAEKMMEAVL